MKGKQGKSIKMNMFFIIFAYKNRNMNDIWNEICFELRACIQNNVLEKEYENAVCNCLVLQLLEKI